MVKLCIAAFASATWLLGVGFEVRVLEETVPPGGIAQMKVALTDPSPISSGGTGIFFDSSVFGGIDGIAAFTPGGDVMGAAWVQGNKVNARFLSPQGNLGATLDYPIMTIAAEVKPGAPVGSKTVVTLDPSASFWSDLLGHAYVQIIKPGWLKVGGSISVRNVVPGGGMQPAGSIVRLDGLGFVSGTSVQVDGVSIASTRIVSPTEIDLTLGESADMHGKRIRVRNPDGSAGTYYSYLRASNLGASSRTLLASTVPIFSTATLSTGAFSPTVFWPSPSAQFNGIALQNSSPGTVSATIALLSAAGASLAQSTISLPSYTRYVRELSEVFGMLPPAGSSVRVSASAAIQMLALAGDDSANTVQPMAVSAAPAPPTVQLSVTPGSLSFNYQIGSAQPASQSLSVTSTVGALSFRASTTASWLSVTPATGSVPTAVTANVNVSGLTAGAYSGSISVSSPPAATQTIPVTLVVTPSPAATVLNASPVSLSFNGQAGGAAPAAQTLTLTSAAAVSFTVGSSAAWMSVTPASGATPGSVSVNVNTTGLAAGAYAAAITVTPTGGAAVTIPVSLKLTAPPSSGLSVAPASLSFNAQAGGAAPAAQTVNVTSAGTAVNLTASSNVAWLSVTPSSGTTPATFSVSVNSAGLAAGAYNGIITVTPASGTSVTIPVAISVTSAPAASLNVSPTNLAFSFQIGGPAPPQQTISLIGSGAPLNFTITTSPAQGSWLVVTPAASATPATLNVSVNPAGLSAGTYNGAITIAPTQGIPGAQTVSVALTVSSAPLLTLSSSSLQFGFQTGAANPPAQTVSVGSTGAPLNFTASVSAGTAWLTVASSASLTPANLSIQVNPGALAPGTYTGSVIVTSGSATQNIAVTLTVSSAAVLRVTPASLTFKQAAGDGAPPTQILTIVSSTGSGTFSATASSNEPGWLSVAPATGSLPGAMTVSVDGSKLGPGAYSGLITVTSPDAANLPQSIPVEFTVSAASALTVSPRALIFNYPGVGPAPSPQTLSLTSRGTTAVNFTSTISPATARWLAVTPPSGLTPATLTASVDPAGLGPGTYIASIDMLPATSATPVSVTATLIVESQTTPVVAALVNAATQQPGALAPGEIISIYGSFPRVETAGMRLDSSGNVATVLSNTRVLFDGVAAPLTYVSNTQINTVVPYEVSPHPATNLQVEVAVARSGPREFQVAPSAPGIFTLDPSGQGAGAVLNQDSTVNGISNPAARGSVVSIYATGGGETSPPSVSGSVAGSELKNSALRVMVTIGGQPAQVTFAGSSPGLVSGVLLVNAQVPDGIAAGTTVPVVLTVGGASSRLNVTIAVQ